MFHFIKIIILPACLFCAQLVYTQQGFAQEKLSRGQLYEALNIQIELNGLDANNARIKALEIAKNRAFQKVLNRLSFNDGKLLSQQISSISLESMIRDVAFAQEQFGGGIYRANIDVRFQSDAIENFFQANDIQYSETIAPKLLTISLLQFGAQTLLWDGDNPLSLALNQQIPFNNDGLVRFQGLDQAQDHTNLISQSGFIDKLKLLVSEPALSSSLPYDRDFTQLGKTYGTDGLLVVNVKLARLGISDIAEIQLIPIAPNWQQQPVSLSLNANLGELRAQFLERIASLALAKTNEIWKIRTFVNPNSALSAIRIIANITNLHDWLKIKDDFAKISGLEGLVVRALKTNTVWFDAYQKGGIDQLAVALNAVGLKLIASDQAGAEYRLVK